MHFSHAAAVAGCGGWHQMTGGRRGHHRGGPWLHGRGGMGFGPGRGRARRGDVRAAILTLLAEGPHNGYAIMQEIAARSGGVWRPSPGSVYPALQQLEDEGLVAPAEAEGRKAFALTDAGREELGRREGPAPWEAVAGDADDAAVALHEALWAVAVAVRQVGQTGSPAQLEAAKQALTDTRKALYRLLADDE